MCRAMICIYKFMNKFYSTIKAGKKLSILYFIILCAKEYPELNVDDIDCFLKYNLLKAVF